MLKSPALKSYYFFASAVLKVHRRQVLAQAVRWSSWRSGGDKAAEFEAARQWFQNFNLPAILELGKLSTTDFSRSSGPGGQKVNKTSSKATTIWPMDDLLRHVPKSLHSGLRANRYYVPSANSILIQCDTHRSQSDNKTATYRRLGSELTEIFKHSVPGETSEDQKQRVIQLQKEAASRRLKTKKQHSEKKQSRNSRGLD